MAYNLTAQKIQLQPQWFRIYNSYNGLENLETSAMAQKGMEY